MPQVDVTRFVGVGVARASQTSAISGITVVRFAVGVGVSVSVGVEVLVSRRSGSTSGF